MVDETQVPERMVDTSVRDGLEIAVYLSVVLAALMLGFEDSLDEGGELLLIWGNNHRFDSRPHPRLPHGIDLRAWNLNHQAVGGLFAPCSWSQS